MNLAKAKDYFSAYYEGSLDKGLQQSFEARLREDAQLQAEYRAFERTMHDLEAMGRIEVEPPADLHDKIAARLDYALWEQKRQKTPLMGLSWWKGLAMGLAVAAGVMAAFIGVSTYKVRSANTIGIPFPTASDTFDVVQQGPTSVLLSHPKVAHMLMNIRDEQTGELKDSEVLTNQPIQSKPLENIGDSAQLLSVEVNSPNRSITYIALPGKVQDIRTSGEGTMKDLALAIAGHYAKPVKLQPRDDADRTVTWDFASSDPIEATNNAVKPLGLTVQLTASGVISIQKE